MNFIQTLLCKHDLQRLISRPFFKMLKLFVHLIERIHGNIEFLFHFVKIDATREKIQNSGHCFRSK